MWVFRFTLKGRTRDMGLGAVNPDEVEAVRQLAKEYRALAKRGVDPIEHRRASVEAEQQAAEEAARQAEAAKLREKTFRQCADEYIDIHKSSWKNTKHAAQWPSTLDAYAHPHFGDLPVADVDRERLLRALQPIWVSKSETASRVRGRIESVLDFAIAKGYRDGPNPAVWRGSLSGLLPKRSKAKTVRHHAALPFPEIPDFIRSLSGHGGVDARALHFLILTATRTSETLNAEWSEIDRSTGTWLIPAERMKSGIEHRVPLSGMALALLDDMATIRRSDFIFPGRRRDRPMSNMALLMLLRRMGRSDLTAHGFRSTFRDWAAETTNHSREVIEMALAHAVGDATERAYWRGDLFKKRRKLMNDWAAYCARETDTIIVPFERREA